MVRTRAGRLARSIPTPSEDRRSRVAPGAISETADLSADEQRGVAAASEHTLDALAEGNRAYEETFGYIFIVCATGKSAEEMLALLCERLNNDPQEELLIAAGEHAKITELRLRRVAGS